MKTVVNHIAANPRYHVARLLDRTETLRRGGPREAAFELALAPGFETGYDPAAAMATPSMNKGMHGYLPEVPAMQSTLIVAGPTIARRGNLGPVDMRAIAPSVAHIVGVVLPDARVKRVF